MIRSKGRDTDREEVVKTGVGGGVGRRKYGGRLMSLILGQAYTQSLPRIQNCQGWKEGVGASG